MSLVQNHPRPAAGRGLQALRRAACGVGLVVFLPLAGCDEPTAELRSSVELVAAEHGKLTEQAWDRIEHHGRAALPYLEAALHRAAPAGRRNVIIALRRLALPESAALLGHTAAFDADAQVRAEAYRTLELWAAASPGQSQAKAAAARTALRQADEVRSAL